MPPKKKLGGLQLDIAMEDPFTVSADGTFQQDGFAIGAGGMQAAGQAGAPAESADGMHPSIKLVEPGQPKQKKKGMAGLSLDCEAEAPAPAPAAAEEKPAVSAAADETMASMASGMSGGMQYDNLEELEQLGAGASGTVWRVRDKSTGNIYALKQIPLEADEAKRKQLIIELKTMHDCDCPEIVTCHGLFYAESAFYIVLELMDSGSFFDLIEASPGKIVPEEVIAIVAAQMCRALRYLHETRKLIHRDLKPPNILVNKSGQFKVADFGVSGVMDQSKSVCASWVGTVTYMSPERIGGEKYGFRSDVWSMGLLLLEAAIGRYPYINSQTPPSLSFWDLLDLIVDKPAPKLPSDKGFSTEFRQFIAATLAKDSKKRPTAFECLKSPFLQKAAKSTFDVAGWIQQTQAAAAAAAAEEAA